MASHKQPLQLLSLDIPQASRAHGLLEQAGIPSQILARPSDCRLACHCQGQLQGELQQLREALRDSVATLERSRHAFRSRELGALRQRLEGLLGNLPGKSASAKTLVQGSAPD